MILGLGVQRLIIKQAEKGATLFAGSSEFHVPAYTAARAVDPTGAGDAFAGGVMGYLAQKNDLSRDTFRQAIVYGHVMGSLNVEGFGAEGLLAASKEELGRRFTSLNR